LISHTAIENVFIDTSTIGKYDLYPLINELSDHEARLLILNKGQKKEKECHTYIKRKIHKYTTADFQFKLSHESGNRFLMGMMLTRFSTILKYFFKNLLLYFSLNSGKE